MRNLAGLVFAVVALGGCAALAPDRTVQSTMTLAPGQSVTGRFSAPDGGSGYLVFQRQSPVRALEPAPGTTTWTGDGKILITFVDSESPKECPLGYASWSVTEAKPRRVVVRNTDVQPVSFDWIVKGSSNVVADWDVSGNAAAR